MRPNRVTMTPEEMVSRVLYRDGLMLVIDKPAGMAVHRGPKGGESLEDHFGALRYGLPRAPALAHRLDRDTSGCLVLGRHRKALAELGRLFKSGRIGKTYWAIVEGGPEAEEGRVDLPLGRLDASRGWWMKADEQGQPAVTTWRVLGRSVRQPASAEGEASASVDGLGATGGASSVPSPLVGKGQGGGSMTDSELRLHPPPQPSPTRGEGAGRACGAAGDSSHRQQADVLTWLALEPITGRTHQLRVHCAEMGWPIVGDAIYGSTPRAGGPVLHLHSREIVVPLYKNRDPIRVVAPVPAHMRERLAACGWQAADEATGLDAHAVYFPPSS
jgi:tRNA pseudouridine32 synthase / 23S rRNA pseudouridine746 synthase